MTPVTFNGCAGWLDVESGGTGVVICAPFGREGMLTYRGCKLLADRLHARGLSVLRFDYPGSGDSEGTEADPDRVATWQRSVADAVGLLRRATSCTDVILIGIRLGATLALRAATSDASIAAVCCLSPIVSGRTYMRELRLLANGWREANLLPAPSTEVTALEVVGDRLDGDTLRDLSAINLRTLERTAPRVLLMDNGSTPLLDDLAGHLQALGAIVTREDFPGAVDFLQNPFATEAPLQAFEAVTSWCVGVPTLATTLPRPPPAGSPPILSSLLQVPEAVEEGGHFGPGGRLYGVSCRPTRHQDAAAPAVLMLNTGFGRRTGDGRVYVTLARRLAGLGIHSFRFDVRGCGESSGRSDPYAPELVDDVAAAADALGRRGFDRLILVGICSGAHAAFHTGLQERRVAGMILINLQKFIWSADTPLSLQNSRQRRPAVFYLKSVARKDAWLRILRGEIAVGAIAIALARRLVIKMCNTACLLLERHAGVSTQAGQVRRWLDDLGRRGVRVDLLYSEGDPGLSELAVAVGSRAGSLRDLPHVRVEVIAQADHALLDHAAREGFINRICRLLQDFGATPPDEATVHKTGSH